MNLFGGRNSVNGMMFSDSERLRLLVSRIDAVFSPLRVAISANIICAILLTFLLRQDETSSHLDIWLVCVLAVSAARYALYVKHKTAPDTAAHIRIWAALSVMGSGSAGLLWGFGGLLLFPSGTEHLWLWSLVVAGLCAGAVASSSAHLPTALIFIVSASLPLFGRLVPESSLGALATAGLISTFILCLIVIAYIASQEFARTFSLRLMLEQKAAELDAANQRLTGEIADHRETSEILDQARKMEAIGRLTAGVAHDFNNLLAIIMGNQELILLRAVDNDDVKRLASTSLDAVKNGAQLTHSLIAFARKQTLKPALVDINALLGKARPLLTNAVGEKITITYATSNQPLPASIDAAQLQIALLNLVINARDAITGPGDIQIGSHAVHIKGSSRLNTGTLLPAGSYAVVTVADTGSGIAPEIVDKIFEPFFTTKGVSHGTGLGLSQVYGFVVQSGGGIDIETTPDQGTSIALYLPLVESLADQGEPVTEPPSGVSASRRHVLLVDDNGCVLAGLNDMLRQEGCAVVTAEDCDAALELLKQHDDIGVMITDIHMPVKDGAELIEAVRTGWPDISIIAMSGSPMDQLPGDVALLPKPFTIRQLRECLASLDEIRARDITAS
ncbi:MAG: response regulator [Sphingobium sp.]|nr:response regulator [Sphingobium sp.]MCP5398582.1 response regulator [Sphingomonas sp.]